MRALIIKDYFKEDKRQVSYYYDRGFTNMMKPYLLIALIEIVSMWSMASANDSTVSNETLNCVENILKNNGMPTDSYANKFPSDPTVDLEDIVLESKKITKTSVKKYSQEFLEMQNIKIEDENTDSAIISQEIDLIPDNEESKQHDELSQIDASQESVSQVEGTQESNTNMDM